MTLADRATLVLAFARVLYVNGQATDEIVAAIARLGAALGVRMTIIPRWGELALQAEDGDNGFVSVRDAEPTGVDMHRVALTMRMVDEVIAGRLTLDAAKDAIARIATAAPACSWMLGLAAAVGAVALAVLFGVQHLEAVMLIFLSAGTGALLRRCVSRYSGNIFLQPFSAALLAGIIGGLAVRFDFSSTLRLVSVCPCVILVPGPHVLNGALDLMSGRIHLGANRLIYAGVEVLAISRGLLLGRALLGVSLAVDQAAVVLPVWQGVIAGGIGVR